MNKYLVEAWYRYGVDQQDFERIEIDADTEEEAHSIAKDLRSLVYKIETIEVNGVKTTKTE